VVEGSVDVVWPETGRKRPGRLEAGWETKGIVVMPNPKRRHSTRRTALRRSHDFLTAVGLSECPACHEKKLPHRACPKCGEYKGRAVVDVKEAAK
jgi:large subunit ribosomal protein L32